MVPKDEQHSGPVPLTPMQGESFEVRDARREWEVANMRRELYSLRKTVEGLENDKDKAMRWGIMALGAAVLAMGTWIFNLIASKIGGP